VEFVVKEIEANIWGNTTESAASSYVKHLADQAESLPRLTELLKQSRDAELPEAIDHLLTCVQTLAALAADVQQMMDALPPLLELVTKDAGVRETKPELIWPIVNGLLERVLIGLPGACASVDDEVARSFLKSCAELDRALNNPTCKTQHQEWLQVLQTLMNREGVNGLVRGYCCRVLFDKQKIDTDELYRQARLALSRAVPTAKAMGWIEGILYGSGDVLLNLRGLWLVLDQWLCDLLPDDFVELLPLLRRAFSGFASAERRSMGEKVRHLHSTNGSGAFTGRVLEIDHERAKRVLPVLAQLLGGNVHGN
jgi:hypothetical protein